MNVHMDHSCNDIDRGEKGGAAWGYSDRHHFGSQILPAARPSDKGRLGAR